MVTLVTGAAGFIGMHVTERLLAEGADVVGIDVVNDYYETSLKWDRIAVVQRAHPGFIFERADIADAEAMAALFDRYPIRRVVHLAAQAGVRYSIQNPHAYAVANLVGFVNVLQECRRHEVEHLAYASSSSVYGGNAKMPFSELDSVDHPVSLYAATKKSNELMAHTYSHLYGLPTTGLRFFTVYGPWGRPDMAPFLFAKAMLARQPIKVYNHGNMRRDFTYIDDIVDGVVAALGRPPQPNASFDKAHPRGDMSWAPYRVFNIGRSEPVELLDFIACMEKSLGVKAQLDLQPMAPGDVEATYADTLLLSDWTGVTPRISLEEGVRRFATWYRSYYKI